MVSEMVQQQESVGYLGMVQIQRAFAVAKDMDFAAPLVTLGVRRDRLLLTVSSIVLECRWSRDRLCICMFRAFRSLECFAVSLRFCFSC
jgi:hypothetical protein